jgi:hypothetical protein
MTDTPIIHGPKRSGRYKAGPGAPRGSRKTKYVTINSILEAIEETLGVTYQQALAELLETSFNDYDIGLDKETYPKLMMKLSDKLVEQARQIPEDTSSELETLTDEELLEKQRLAVVEYIKTHGIPKMEAA